MLLSTATMTESKLHINSETKTAMAGFLARTNTMFARMKLSKEKLVRRKEAH